METNNSTSEAKGFYKLNWLQRIGFGSGDLAQNLIYQTICMYLLFFYTDFYVLGGDAAKSAGLAGTMFLVVRLVDVLWDPLVGTFVDKHNPKLGKYRSYLVTGGIPLTILAILCFWDGFAPSLIYAYLTYVGMSMLYTLINVPYGALNSSLTRSGRFGRRAHSRGHLCLVRDVALRDGPLHGSRLAALVHLHAPRAGH